MASLVLEKPSNPVDHLIRMLLVQEKEAAYFGTVE
jgi:hypothetical protein